MEAEPESLGITYRTATLGEILPLREWVIIQGTDRVSPHFPDDDAPSTYHLGAFRDGKNIACLSLMWAPYEGKNAFQLRGMAVRPEYQGEGVGRSLLNFAEKWIKRNTSCHLIWCNARTPAMEFYLKHGWEAVSDEFPIEGVGPHYRMIRELPTL